MAPNPPQWTKAWSIELACSYKSHMQKTWSVRSDSLVQNSVICVSFINLLDLYDFSTTNCLSDTTALLFHGLRYIPSGTIQQRTRGLMPLDFSTLGLFFCKEAWYTRKCIATSKLQIVVCFWITPVCFRQICQKSFNRFLVTTFWFYALCISGILQLCFFFQVDSNNSNRARFEITSWIWVRNV